MLLSCKNISCSRGQDVLLDNINLDIESGKPLIFTGSNGSGKTTLLKTIAGLIPPQKGAITWENINIKDCYKEYSENLEYVGHKTGLKNELTVEENLDFWAEIHNTKEAVVPAIMYFGLAEIFDVPVAKLSEGQKRRVSLARLLCCPSMIWLLDEPTVNLDEDGKNMLRNIIITRAEQGGIVIITTHADLNIPNARTIKLTDFIPEK